MRRPVLSAIGALAVLAARVALAQPVPRIGTETPTPAGASTTQAPPASLAPATPVPTETVVSVATPVPAASPVASVAAGAATPAATPDAAQLANIPMPGAELKLELPSTEGEPGSVLSDPQRFAALSPMEQAWFLRQHFAARGDSENAKKYLQIVIDLRLDSGLENTTRFAAALVQEARARVADGHPADAVAAASAAAELAPDFPPANTALARAELANGNVGAVPGALERAARAAARNLRVRMRMLGNLSLALLAGGWMAFALFLLLAYVRHLRFLVHDFRHAFADKLPGFLAALLIVPVLAFPVVFGLGWVPLFAWLTVAIWAQLTKRERAVAAAFLLLGIATPVVGRQIAGFLAFEGGTEGLLFHAVREDAPDADTLERLSAIAEETKDADVLLTIANAYGRTGQYPLAEQLYRKAEDAGAGANAEVGAGVMRYALGDPNGAIAAFEKVLASDGQHVAAHFNLSQIYAELEKSQTHLVAAKAVDARRCDHVLGMSLPPGRKVLASIPGVVPPAYLNHFFLFDDVPDERLHARVFSSGAADALLQRSWDRVSPAVSLYAVTGIFVAALAAAGLLTLALRQVVATRPCPKCGTRLCLRCDGPPLDYDFCVQCFHTYVDTSDTDPRIRAEKERQVAARLSRRRTLRRLASILVPGGGHLLHGNTVRGTILLVLASAFAARLLVWRGVFLPVVPDGGSGPVVIASVCGAALVVVWLWGMGGTGPEPEGR